MKQHPAATPINFNVPTTEQMTGDFSETTIVACQRHASIRLQCTEQQSSAAAACPAAAFGSTLILAVRPPTGTTTMPTSDYDPNIAGICCLDAQTDITPSLPTAGTTISTSAPFRRTAGKRTGKVDYAISDNTKLTVPTLARLKTISIRSVSGGLHRGPCRIRRTWLRLRPRRRS